MSFMSRTSTPNRWLHPALRRAFAYGCVVLAFAAGAGAQTPTPAVTPHSSPHQLPARLSPSTRATIERLADSLAQAGVPTAPLYGKAAEGVLKGADDTRIVAAIRTLARELGTAAAMLGPSASVNDVEIAASALNAGVPLSAAQKIVSRRAKSGASDGRIALSFVILSDLAARNVPIDAAVSAVDGLLSRGAGSAELSAFRTGVVNDLKAGRDPRATLQTRAESVLRRP